MMRIFLMTTAFLALAGVTDAQPLSSPAIFTVKVEAPGIAGPKPATVEQYAERAALRAAGLARTAIDRRFSDSDDKAVTGSLGFLCGLQPNPADKGAPAAYGVDPHGRFVGAKLAFAF